MAIQPTIVRGKKKVVNLIKQEDFEKLVLETGETGMQFWAITARSKGATDEQLNEGLKFLENDKLGVAAFLIGHAIIVGAGLKR